MYNEVMENTDFVIEHIDKEVKVITDRPSSVVNYPANTDFFIENIDDNVISIAHSLNIEASEVEFRPANTDFFIENIDNNVIMIAESLELEPSEVEFRPANTDFFVENIDKNLIAIAECYDLEPSRVVLRPANTDMFIENIDRNVTLIKSRTNVITKSGSFINVDVPDGGTMQLTAINGNATQNGTPTPDAPVSIETVTGEQTVKVEGKNLFDKDNANIVHYLIGNTSFASAANANTIYIPVIGGQTYTISTTDRSLIENDSSMAFTDALVDAGHLSYISRTTWSSSINSVTVTAPNNAKFLYAYVKWTSSGLANTLATIQLELGSTATTYEPYQAQTKTVNLGKNLLQNMTGLSNNGLTGTVASDGTISVSGQASNTYSFFTDTTNQSIPAGDYTFSDGLPSTSAYRCIIRFTFSDNTTQEVDLRNQGTGKAFTLTQKATKAQIRIAGITSGTQYDFTVKPMVELGSTATAYAPYFTPIELAKIGTYQDRIYKTDGKWYIEKQVGKAIFTGASGEQWGGEPYGGYWRVYHTFSDIAPISQNADFAGLSDYFHMSINVLGAQSIKSGDFCQFRNTLTVYFAPPLSVQSSSDWRTWLSTHPTTVYYALATPTTTEITDETLIEQLKFITDMYEGINNISFIGTGAQGTIEVVINKN